MVHVLPAVAGQRSEGNRSMAMFVTVAGKYIMPNLAGWQDARLDDNLTRLAATVPGPLWLVIDSFYAAGQQARLRQLLEAANRQQVAVLPVLGTQVPEDKRSDWATVPVGTPAEAAAMRTPDTICLRHPDVLAFVAARAAAFMAACGDMDCLQMFAGVTALHFGGELDGPQPAGPCYCDHCAAAFVAAENDPTITAPPHDVRDPALWGRWLAFQKQTLPAFVVNLARETRGIVPLWMAH